MNFHFHKRYILLALIILAGILVLLCYLFFQQYRDIVRSRLLDPQKFTHITKSHIPLGPNDVQVIAPWMTFDYINYIFGLPKVYLSSTLGITDVYYPHIPLIRYARESNVPIETLVLEAQDAVTAYFLTVSK